MSAEQHPSYMNPGETAHQLAASALADPLNTQQAIELAKVYATLELAEAVRANRPAPRTRKPPQKES